MGNFNSILSETIPQYCTYSPSCVGSCTIKLTEKESIHYELFKKTI